MKQVLHTAQECFSRILTKGNRAFTTAAVCFATFSTTYVVADNNPGTGAPWRGDRYVKESVEMRSRTSKSFERADGKMSSFISPTSIHYRNAGGVWTDISNQIISNTGPGSAIHPFKNEENAVRTYFPADPFTGNLEMRLKEGTVTEKIKSITFLDKTGALISTLPISPVSNVTTSENTIIYNGIHPHLSLAYSLGSDARKFDLRVMSPSFLSQIPAAAHYIAVNEEIVTGDAQIVSNENGLEVVLAEQSLLGFVRPAAYSGNTAEEPVSGEFVLTVLPSGYQLSSLFSVNWIKQQQNAHYPLHLDPTLNYYPNNVTYACGYQTSATAKTSGYIRVAGANNNGWATFDLTSVPSTAIIFGATYFGYHYTTAGPKIVEVRGLGSTYPIAAATTGAQMFTAITTGPLYSNTYVFGDIVNNWQSVVLGGSANADITAALAQGWFGLGFSYLSGTATFMYQYGINGSLAQFPYLELTWFSTPCSGNPYPNSVLSPTYMLCPGESVTLTLTDTYTIAGLTYQWNEATLSPVGPFNPIPGGTTAVMPVVSSTSTTWYNVTVTCTNSPQGTVTVSSGTVMVQGSVTSVAPYHESFETIGVDDRMPNCSWLVPNLGTTAKTYATAQSANLLPNTGSSFASFNNGTIGDDYYFTNAIMLHANVTYSASLWYVSDFSGGTNWTDLEILIGTSQSSTGLTQVAHVSPAASPFYKPMSNVFTVPSTGFYYIAVKATNNGAGSPTLAFDDLRIDIPCNAGNNTPVVTASANNPTVCANEPVVLTGSGAMTYSWSTGALTPATIEYPSVTTVYQVTGSNTITNCSASKSVLVSVKTLPLVSAVAVPPTICPGGTSNLQAAGNAMVYQWSASGGGANVNVSPTSPTSYTVLGTGSNGCVGKSVVSVDIHPQPNVTGSASNFDLCAGDELVLTGNGADSYIWHSLSPGVVFQGQKITTYVHLTTTFTVTGTDNNGCTDTDIVSLNVQECTGLEKLTLSNGLLVFPNPASGQLTISFRGGEANIEVADVSGRMLLKTVADGSVNLDIHDFAAGIYTAKISIDGTTAAVKIVKE